MEKTTIKERVSRMMTWEGGQRLFNFAYSIGAAIVIWGALFKILHLPGGRRDYNWDVETNAAVDRHGNRGADVYPHRA